MKFTCTILILLSFGIFFSCTNDQPKKKPKLAKTESTKKPTPTPNSKAEEVAVEPQKEEKPEVPEEVIKPVPPEQLAKAKEIIASVSAGDLAGVDGKKKYKMYCAACHGFNGQLGVNGAKDLSESQLKTYESVAQIYFGRGLMTPFKGILKDAEIVAVSKYIEKELR